MADIYIKKKNEVYNTIEAEEGILREISDVFSFEVEGREYMPSYKNRQWDGVLRIFNRKNQTLYGGLLPHMCIFANREGYSIDVDEAIVLPDNKTSREEVISYFEDILNVHAHGEKISPRDAQIDSFIHALASERCVLEAATSSGKSLTIYALIRYYEECVKSISSGNKKILIIVPSINLVNQMYSDFEDYSSHNSWNVEDHCHLVYEGQEKIDTDKNVVISTYQSIYKLDRKYFNNFDVVIGDEAHKFKAKTLKGIMQKLVDCPFRIAMTGTLHDAECHKWIIEGLFGMAKEIITAREMIDAGQAPPLRIECVLLQYPIKDCKEVSGMTYQEEKHYIAEIPERNDFIVNLANDLPGNTLILSELVKLHLLPLHELLQKNTDRTIYMVHGETDGDQREYIRQIMEEEDNAIIIASYGVFSTGVSIKKLHNMIFAGSPGKQKQRVVQSIGRALRQHESKKEAVLYDIVDDFTYKKKKNFMLKHFMERVKIYINEDHPYKIIPIYLKGE